MQAHKKLSSAKIVIYLANQELKRDISENEVSKENKKIPIDVDPTFTADEEYVVENPIRLIRQLPVENQMVWVTTDEIQIVKTEKNKHHILWREPLHCLKIEVHQFGNIIALDNNGNIHFFPYKNLDINQNKVNDEEDTEENKTVQNKNQITGMMFGAAEEFSLLEDGRVLVVNPVRTPLSESPREFVLSLWDVSNKAPQVVAKDISFTFDDENESFEHYRVYLGGQFVAYYRTSEKYCHVKHFKFCYSENEDSITIDFILMNTCDIASSVTYYKILGPELNYVTDKFSNENAFVSHVDGAKYSLPLSMHNHRATTGYSLKDPDLFVLGREDTSNTISDHFLCNIKLQHAYNMQISGIVHAHGMDPWQRLVLCLENQEQTQIKVIKYHSEYLKKLHEQLLYPVMRHSLENDLAIPAVLYQLIKDYLADDVKYPSNMHGFMKPKKVNVEKNTATCLVAKTLNIN